MKVEILIEYGFFKIKIFKKIVFDKYVDLIVCGVIGLNVVECILIGSVF